MSFCKNSHCHASSHWIALMIKMLNSGCQSFFEVYLKRFRMWYQSLHIYSEFLHFQKFATRELLKATVNLQKKVTTKRLVIYVITLMGLACLQISNLKAVKLSPGSLMFLFVTYLMLSVLRQSGRQLWIRLQEKSQRLQ